MRYGILLLALLPARALASTGDVLDCLNAVDVPCAQAALARNSSPPCFWGWL